MVPKTLFVCFYLETMLVDFCKISISAQKKGSFIFQLYFLGGKKSVIYKFIQDM